MCRGSARTKTFRITTISPKPITRPRIGDENSGTRILPAKVAHWTAPVPADAHAAPIRPPISAWLLELGIDNRQVIRFQEIAPSKAAERTVDPFPRTSLSSTIPLPIVPATAVPNTIAPTKLAVADRRMAYSGLIARVATEVAMALAVSWKPLM